MEEATASTRSLEQIPTFLHVHVVRGRISEAEFAFFSSPLKDSEAAKDGVPQLLYKPRPHPGRHGFLLEGKLLKWFRKKKAVCDRDSGEDHNTAKGGEVVAKPSAA